MYGPCLIVCKSTQEQKYFECQTTPYISNLFILFYTTYITTSSNPFRSQYDNLPVPVDLRYNPFRGLDTTMIGRNNEYMGVR